MGKIPVNTQPEALCKYVAENMSVNVILTCIPRVAEKGKVHPGRDPRCPGKAINRAGGRHLPEPTVRD